MIPEFPVNRYLNSPHLSTREGWGWKGGIREDKSKPDLGLDKGDGGEV